MAQIVAINFTGGQITTNYDRDSNICPFCHKSITPRKYQGFVKGHELEIVFGCPDDRCGRVFLSYYKNERIGSSWIYVYKSSSVGNFKSKEFSENIIILSPNFIEIFNQASMSESLNLNHISGIGYRKALEFLIKDYLIHKNSAKTESIKKKFLGNCIKEDIDNINLKNIAERAVWLGNDETHYVRKWVDKDISDLKKLIELSLHWIEMELLTEQYKSDMA